MKIKEIMSKNVIYLSPGDTVSKAISLIEKHNFRQIPIIEKKRLRGIVYSKDIAKKGIKNPSKTKISSIINFHPATISPDQEIEKAAKLILKTGLRALPVIQNEKVVGLISMHDIVDSVSKTKSFRQTKVKEIMTTTPKFVDKNTDIGKARYLMRQKNISRLPVVDEDGKIMGIVNIFDLLKAVKPRERINFYSMAGEKETIMGTTISTILDRKPVTIGKEKTLNDLVNLLSKYKTDGVIVEENNEPVGVITTKDLLEFYVSTLKKEGIYYQIIGLKDEDDFTVNTIDRMIRDTIEKMSKMFNTKSFILHIKRYNKKGKTKYSIRTRFLTNEKIFVSKYYAWDLKTAVDKSLDKLQRIMIKEKRERREKIEKLSRFKKTRR